MGCLSSRGNSETLLALSSQAKMYTPEDNLRKIDKLTKSPERNISKTRMKIKNAHTSRHRKLTTSKNIKQQIKRHLNQISHLTLTWKYKENTEGMHNLSQTLRSIKSLDKLSLDCRTQPILASQILKALYSKLKHMRSMKKLDLSLVSYIEDFTNPQIEKLCLALHYLHGLSVLNLQWWTNINNEGLDSLASGLKHLRSLVAFRLSIFSRTPLNTQGISSIFSSLKHLHSFCILGLGLDVYEDQTLQTLLSGLKSQKFLSALDLKIFFNKSVSLQAIPVEIFLNGLGSITCITDLNLSFSDYSTLGLDNQITGNELCLKILDNLMLALPQQLRSLSFSFRPCYNIYDKGREVFCLHLINCLSLALRHLTCLTLLTLILQGSPNIEFEGTGSSFEILEDLKAYLLFRKGININQQH